MSLAAELLTKVDAAQTLLGEIDAAFAPAIFTTSFGAEDMVLLDLIGRERKAIRVVTLDTGRLPAETYDVWQRAEACYLRRIEAYVPESAALEQYVRVQGINAFYDSISQRKACCHIRKVEPLARALAGQRAWITGLRRSQASSRAELTVSEWDEGYGIHKFSPLAHWSEAEVWSYIRDRAVPYNALHDLGYPSIGCAPCTRAIHAGEDVRAGRWWWENGDAKECGLHAKEVTNV